MIWLRIRPSAEHPTKGGIAKGGIFPGPPAKGGVLGKPTLMRMEFNIKMGMMPKTPKAVSGM